MRALTALAGVALLAGCTAPPIPAADPPPPNGELWDVQ